MLTNERLKEIAQNPSGEPTRSSMHTEWVAMARDLLAIREAGDEEIELLHEEVGFSFGNPYVAQQNKSREALENLRHIAITRGQQLRNAQAEIERLKVSSFSAPEGATIQSLQSQIATLTAELAALKAAPGMEEIDALWKEFKVKRHKLAIRLHGAELEEICQLDEIVMSIRRKSICSIASRDEVVGLLKHILSCIITVKQENTPEWMEYIAEEVNRINEAMGDPDRVSLRFGGIVIVKGGPEIVEGKMPNEILKELEVNLENARGGQNTGDIEAAIIAIEEYKRKKLVDGLLAVESLILESSGVAGLHRNGDLASWDELRTGGRFEEWLYQLDDALEIARSDHADRRERRGEEGN